MGNISLKEIDAGVADPSERTFVQVGRILGMVATLLMVLIGCAYLAFVAGIIGLVAIGGSSAR